MPNEYAKKQLFLWQILAVCSCWYSCNFPNMRSSYSIPAPTHIGICASVFICVCAHSYVCGYLYFYKNDDMRMYMFGSTPDLDKEDELNWRTELNNPASIVYPYVGSKWTCAYIDSFKFDYTSGQNPILILHSSERVLELQRILSVAVPGHRWHCRLVLAHRYVI